MLVEVSLLGRGWYPSQVARSWGAQQGAGEKGSRSFGRGRFPRHGCCGVGIIATVQVAEVRKVGVCGAAFSQQLLKLVDLHLLPLLHRQHVPSVVRWSESRSAELPAWGRGAVPAWHCCRSRMRPCYGETLPSAVSAGLCASPACVSNVLLPLASPGSQ